MVKLLRETNPKNKIESNIYLFRNIFLTIQIRSKKLLENSKNIIFTIECLFIRY